MKNAITILDCFSHTAKEKKIVGLVDQAGKKYSHGLWKLVPKEKVTLRDPKASRVEELRGSAGQPEYLPALPQLQLQKNLPTNIE